MDVARATPRSRRVARVPWPAGVPAMASARPTHGAPSGCSSSSWPSSEGAHVAPAVSGIAYAGRSGSIEPSATSRAGDVPCPPWLRELAERVSSTPPEWFSRFLPPDEGARESAVLILFGPPPEGATGDGEHVVLIERSHTMRTQPAQIAFPGGARDAGDDDLAGTALREA